MTKIFVSVITSLYLGTSLPFSYMLLLCYAGMLINFTYVLAAMFMCKRRVYQYMTILLQYIAGPIAKHFQAQYAFSYLDCMLNYAGIIGRCLLTLHARKHFTYLTALCYKKF